MRSTKEIAMPDKTARGRFVWHELIAPDTAKAQEFYGKVVGWKTQPFEADPSYQMFAASTGPLGGAVADSERPSHWLPYLGTTDIEATVRQAVQLGATVVQEIAPIANGGRWARLNDPQGAAFAVHHSPVRPGREKPPKRGEFSWHELMTTDYKAAFEFYSALFGWETSGEMDMGKELGVYFMFGRNGVPLGGIFNVMPGMEGEPSWTGYIRVKDVNKAVKKAQSAGATLINGPMEVPGGDWIAQFMDPQGAMFAVHALKADLAPAEAEPAAITPQQGTLDFPPADSAGPETVSVVSQKPAANKSAKQASAATTTKDPAVKQTTNKAASAQKAPALKAPAKKAAPAKKPSAKRSSKKAVKKPTPKKKSVAVKAGKKTARKAPAKKAKKSARPAAKQTSSKKARRPK
jgi:predicted enzyme related to lactoylglutathione lyase